MIGKRLLIPVVILLAASCSKNTGDEPAPAPSPPDYSSVQIPASQVPLFAKLSGYNLVSQSPATKSGEPTVSLESLLDQAHASERPFEGKTFRQVPFFQNYEARLASIGDDPAPDITSATVVKKFLVTVIKADSTSDYVVTMVTGRHYAQSNPDFDYLHKSNYTGIILFSTLEGAIAEVRRYVEGRAMECRLLAPGEMQEADPLSLHFINLYAARPETKSQEENGEDGGELEASICVAEMPKPKPAEWDNYDWDDWLYPFSGGGSGGGGSSSGGSGSGDGGDDSDLIQIDKTEYTVSLSSNLPQYISMQGSGSYEEGTTIAVGYLFNYLVVQVEFSMWTGDFSDRTTPTFTYKVTRNITSTAYFDYQSPCADNTKNVTNPLIAMSVAPSGGWNYYGGTFGWTRSSGTQEHSGLDLEASLGTPVYAMYSGTVHVIESGAKNEHERRSYGNEIVIECVVNGQTLYFQYAHLQYGNPVAINPRTWEPFQEGDEVFAGDMIGYSGKTGNAFRDKDVPVKHLHLGVSTNWSSISRKLNNWIDPSPYINGTIDASTIMDSKGSVDDINCD